MDEVDLSVVGPRRRRSAAERLLDGHHYGCEAAREQQAGQSIRFRPEHANHVWSYDFGSAKYVGLEVDQVRQLKHLRDGSTLLSQLVDEPSLDKTML
ncbi:hypothetical protein [Granulicella aggregans]|uniref:hypothetical protein n=1 Tax=Granulicella aggregans TaxID=474949 RepID=UPI0021E02FF4|nr:hypothetical protein [Granulicella aggregans]